jgi:hypothetical protein
MAPRLSSLRTSFRGVIYHAERWDLSNEMYRGTQDWTEGEYSSILASPFGILRLLDHLIRPRQHVGPNRETDLLCGFDLAVNPVRPKPDGAQVTATSNREISGRKRCAPGLYARTF